MKPQHQISFLVMIVLLTSIKQIQTLQNHNFNPKSMDYELRRPITYLYNRLAGKFQMNPYTSHLVDTEFSCSSKKGPFCGFINNEKLMQQKIKIPENLQQLRTLLVANAQSSRQLARNIENGNLDAFLISSESHKQYDAVIKQLVDPYFYQSAELLNKNKKHQTVRNL